NGLSVTVQGIDLQTYVEVVGGVNIVEGKMFSCGNCSEAVVGRSLLLELNATVGSRLNLSIGSGVSEVLVSGVFETGMRIQEMVVYVPLDLVQKLAGMEGYATQILVKCESPRVVEAVVNSITSAFPGLSAVSMVAALQRVEEAVNTMTAFFLSIGAVALTAGGFGVMNTMFMAVVERTREIGILKSVGATDRFVFTLFITESALIGFTGSFTGLVVGIALSRLIPTAVVSIGGARSPGARSLQPPTNLRIAELVITPEAVSIAVVTGIAVATVAGLLPAYRAARMKPVEAVRYV
ncbi:MAG: FtsX-like permease family protein, partial [Sulfolobales archaeon]|nr:FtsX-like permease family protein [Sulfolobales archaeon]